MAQEIKTRYIIALNELAVDFLLRVATASASPRRVHDESTRAPA